MPPESPLRLVAVDIGNTRIKLGLFAAAPADELPEPTQLATLGTGWTADDLASCLGALPPRVGWRIVSVQRSSLAQLQAALAAGRHDDVHVLEHRDLPLAVDLEAPERVGVDRLVNAVAANRLRNPLRPAIVCDVGSAITVDAVAADGRFLGGAILPGIGMSARALHEFTDLLPLDDTIELAEPPTPLGRATVPAIRSGLFWGAVGAMRELVSRLSGEIGGRPQVLLTGGAAPSVATLLVADDGETARYVPHLTLAGIVLSAGSSRQIGR